MLVFCLIDDGSLGSWEDATLDASLQALNGHGSRDPQRVRDSLKNQMERLLKWLSDSLSALGYRRTHRLAY